MKLERILKTPRPCNGIATIDNETTRKDFLGERNFLTYKNNNIILLWL
jgi:hypothetical protein